jgi:uncharacterized phage-associated protein
MRFPFDEEKTTQAAAYLLKLNGGTLPYIVLIKLLYLADREMLAKHGRPITGDKLVSMKHGPVLSRVLDLVSNGPDDSSPSSWFRYITEPDSYDVSLREVAPTDALSRFEMRLLEGIYQRYGRMDKWKLRDLLHKILPEWKDPGSSMSDIDPVDILRAADWDEAAIDEAKSNAREDLFLASLSG